MALSLPDNKTALVWGAQGFIGRALVPRLLIRGWTVKVLARRRRTPCPQWTDEVGWIEFAGAATFDAALDGVSVVFNLAGSSGAVASNRDPLESLESNCRRQLEFLGACARSSHRPHVVLASSRLVYAPAGRVAVTEEHPVAPLSIYGVHKLCVEHYHRISAERRELTFTLCRISNPYGRDESAPDKGYGFINALINRALNGEPMTLFGDGRHLRDYIYIDDLVSALLLCAERREARNALLNIGQGQSMAIAEASAAIQWQVGGTVEHIPWPPDYESVESGDFVMDIGKARTLLGFSPSFTFADGLRDITRLGCSQTSVEDGKAYGITGRTFQ